MFLLLLCVFFITGGVANAQSSTSSQYTQLGLGDLQSSAFAKNSSMGGLSQAINNSNAINLSNPASYSSLELTTFEAGIFSNFAKYSNSANSFPTSIINNTSIAYLAFAFPISKKWGSSFGLVPYSDVEYNMFKMETTQLGPVKDFYSGTGGINRFYIGNAFKPFKGLSVGFNASYLLGSIDKEKIVEFNPTFQAYNTQLTNILTVGDFYFNYGAIYTQEFKNDYSASLGFSGSTAKAIKATMYDLTRQRGWNVNGNPVNGDTTSYNPNQKGKLALPAYVSGGLVIRKKNKWMFGVDYYTQDWSKYTAFGENGSLANSSKIILGGEYFFKRILYRAGLRYEKTDYKINDIQVNERAFSVGIGFPISNGQSFLNISAEAAERGSLSNDLIREQYLRITLGLTLSDRWFIKRKFD